jgi:DNA-binding transcriptional MerR regulator
MPDDNSPSLFSAVPPERAAQGGKEPAATPPAPSGPAPAGAPPVGSLFPDGKTADALRTIGEVAAALGIRQHVLRYWEEQFPMLRPLKRSGSRRYYRPGDIALVQRIDQLVHKQGYTLRGARLVLQGKAAEAEADRASQAPPSSAAVVTEPVTGLTDRLKAIRARLAAAAA